MTKIGKILKNDKLEKRFIIEDANPALLNEIKRVSTNQAPVMAMEDIFYTNNTSALYDEILAHRLGLVPLTTSKEYNKKDECKCKGKGCALCRVKLTLNVKGPKSVYASDIKSKDPKVKPVYPNMLIIKLLEGHEIELEAHAYLGTGEEHAKWSPCLAYYQGYPKIEIDKKVDVSVAKVCPKHVFEVKNKKLEVINLIDCNLCKACENESEGLIKVSSEEGKFIFSLESWGQLPPEEILKESIKIIKNKIKNSKLN